jgi:hypothetical protein
MLQISSKIATIAMASAFALGSAVTSFAMPVPTMPTDFDQPSTDIQQVDWHGHGGYYHHHHDNYWAPLAGFGAGALVGGLIASQSYNGNYYQGGYYHGYPAYGNYAYPSYYGYYRYPRYYGYHRTYYRGNGYFYGYRHYRYYHGHHYYGYYH